MSIAETTTLSGFCNGFCLIFYHSLTHFLASHDGLGSALTHHMDNVDGAVDLWSGTKEGFESLVYNTKGGGLVT